MLSAKCQPFCSGLNVLLACQFDLNVDVVSLGSVGRHSGDGGGETIEGAGELVIRLCTAAGLGWVGWEHDVAYPSFY